MSSLVVVEASELERLTLDDAARFLSFTPTRILELVRDRGLPAEAGPDGAPLFSREAMLRWIDALPTTPQPRATRGRPRGTLTAQDLEWWAEALRIGVPRAVLSACRGDVARVYFVEAGSTLKIGLAVNVRARVARLQTSCPMELRLVGSVAGPRALEQWLHQRFWQLRIRGEWFRLEGDLAEMVALLGCAA